MDIWGLKSSQSTMNQQNNQQNTDQSRVPKTPPVIPDLNHILNIEGMLETRTTAPTSSTVVKKLADGVLIYVDSTSSPTVMRLYVYSRAAKKWGYTTLTMV